MPRKDAARKRVLRAERRRAHEAALAEALELSDENIAPAAQRETRLVRYGNTFRVGSPIIRLYRSGARRRETGRESPITAKHLQTADRLQRAWEICQTVTAGVGSYGEGTGGAGQSGVIAQAVISAVHQQCEARDEVAHVCAELGPLWPVVETVVLKHRTVKDWCIRSGFDQMVGVGYLRAGLDVLAAVYRKKDQAL